MIINNKVVGIKIWHNSLHGDTGFYFFLLHNNFYIYNAYISTIEKTEENKDSFINEEYILANRTVEVKSCPHHILQKLQDKIKNEK